MCSASISSVILFGTPRPPNSLPISNGAAQNAAHCLSATLPTALTATIALTVNLVRRPGRGRADPALKFAVVAPNPAPTLPRSNAAPALPAAA